MFQFVSQYEYHVIEPSVTQPMPNTKDFTDCRHAIHCLYFSLCAYDVECSDDDGKFRRKSAADR